MYKYIDAAAFRNRLPDNLVELLTITAYEVHLIIQGKFPTDNPIYFKHVEISKDENHLILTRLKITEDIEFVQTLDNNFKHISFNYCEIQSIGFWHGRHGHINIHESNLETVDIMGGEYERIYFSGKFEKNKIHELRIGSRLFSLQGRILISHFTINSLAISGNLESKLTIDMQHLELAVLDFKFIDNQGNLRLGDIIFKDISLIDFYSGYLGKAQFYKVRFDQASGFTVNQAYVADCSFLNCTWPPLIQFQHPRYKNGPDFKVRATPNQKDDLMHFFSQLKIAYSRQKDGIHEHYFHAFELREYYHLLSWHKTFWTKFVIGLSFMTSDFGQSILRPILFILFANGGLYMLLQYFDVRPTDRAYPNSRFVFIIR